MPWDQLVCWEFQAAFGDYGHIIKIETPLNGTAAPRKQHRAINTLYFVVEPKEDLSNGTSCDSIAKVYISYKDKRDAEEFKLEKWPLTNLMTFCEVTV